MTATVHGRAGARAGTPGAGLPPPGQGRPLERDDIWDRMVKPGDRLPAAVSLVEADLGAIHVDRMLRTGPVVLVFFQHAGSRACATALADYQERLLPPLEAADAHLVAISPQLPARLAEMKHRLDLSFFVAADVRHRLIDAFNLGFHDPGADVILGTRRSVVPFPAAVVADRAGVVRFTDVRPAGAKHPDPAGIAAAVRALR